MQTRIAYLILFFQLMSCGFAYTQNTTIINRYNGDTTITGTEGFVPTRTSEHRIIINYYEPANQAVLDNFQNLVGSYLNLYIDRCAHIVKNDVRLKKSKKETLRDLNNVVKGVLDFYEYEKLKDFKSFSKMVEDKLNSIDKLDFRKTNIAADAASEEDRQYMQKLYLQKELNDLKILTRMEMGIFSSGNLMVVSSEDETVIDSELKERLLEDYTSYDPNMPLKPIKVKLSDESLALISFKDPTTISGKPESGQSFRDKDDEFAKQVLQLLEANNNKLDGMQKQIDDLRMEQMKLWQTQQDEKSLAMQKQIDDLRDMVFALVQMSTGDALADREKTSVTPEKFRSTTVSNVPSSVNIYFAKASNTLDAGSKLALNEVVDILARDPLLNIIITGYADKTGDAARNLVLSQQRANSVKKFLADSGLPSDRFITKYFGDRDSERESKNDRRVSLEFVR